MASTPAAWSCVFWVPRPICTWSWPTIYLASLPCAAAWGESRARTGHGMERRFGLGPAAGEGERGAEPAVDQIGILAAFLQRGLIKRGGLGILAEGEMGVARAERLGAGAGRGAGAQARQG